MLAKYLFNFGRGVFRFFVKVQLRLAFDDQLQAGPIYMQMTPNQQQFQAKILTGSGLQTGIAVHAGLGDSQINTSFDSSQQQFTECSNNSQLKSIPTQSQPYVNLGVDLGTQLNGHNLRNRVANGTT